MTYRKLVVSAMVALAAGLAWLSPSANAQASISGVGYWSSNPAGSAPAGGFEVSRGPTGETTGVAAFKITVESDELTEANLTLNEQTGGAVAALQVCRVGADWAPVQRGRLQEAPKPDCTSPVDMTRDAANPQAPKWKANVVNLLPPGKGTYAVYVQPAPQPVNTPPGVLVPVPLPVRPEANAPFQIGFSGAEMQAQGSSFSGDSGGTSETLSESAIGSLGGETVAAPTDFGTSTDLGTVAFDDAPEPAAPVLDAPAQTPGNFPRRIRLNPTAGDPAPWGRLLFFVPLAAVLGTVATFGRKFLRNADLPKIPLLSRG